MGINSVRLSTKFNKIQQNLKAVVETLERNIDAAAERANQSFSFELELLKNTDQPVLSFSSG